MHRQPTKLGLDFRAVVELLLRLRGLAVLCGAHLGLQSQAFLLLSHRLLGLMKVDVVVPDLRCIVALGADVLPPSDVRVVTTLEQLFAVDLGHSHGEAEVGQQHLAFAVYEQIFRLDVTMNNTMRVEIACAFDELVDYVSRHPLCEWGVAMLDETIQLAEFCQLHHIITKVALALFDDEVRLLVDSSGLLLLTLRILE